MIVNTLCGAWLHVSTDPMMVSPLTHCCEAAATGSGMAVVCKGCYREVPTGFGACATTLPELEALLAGLYDCPTPENCASEVVR